MAVEPRTVTFDLEYQIVKFEPRREKEDADLDRHQRRIVFYVVIVVLVIVTLGCAYLAFLVPATTLNDADKEWARSILASVISGLIGYAFGRKH